MNKMTLTHLFSAVALALGLGATPALAPWSGPGGGSGAVRYFAADPGIAQVG